MGIYIITNVINKKSYVGSACNLRKRWQDHVRDLAGNKHANGRLQNAWNKYGDSAFEFSVKEYVEVKESLLSREQHWIDSLSAVMTGYNIAPTAGSMIGYKHTDATREKLSISHMGYKRSPESIAKQVASITGKPKSKEHIAKVAAAQKGKFVSVETRLKISESQKDRVRQPLSEITKAKIAAAHLGRSKPKHTDEQKMARSAWQTGRKNSPESIEKQKATRLRNKLMRANEPGQAFQQ